MNAYKIKVVHKYDIKQNESVSSRMFEYQHILKEKKIYIDILIFKSPRLNHNKRPYIYGKQV